MRAENAGESGQLLFIWLPVGADINISEIENTLNCVSLKQSSSNIVLLRQGARNYIGRHWFQNRGGRGLPGTELFCLKLYKAA